MHHRTLDADALSGVLVLFASALVLGWSTLWVAAEISRMSIDVSLAWRLGLLGM